MLYFRSSWNFFVPACFLTFCCLPVLFHEFQLDFIKALCLFFSACLAVLHLGHFLLKLTLLHCFSLSAPTWSVNGHYNYRLNVSDLIYHVTKLRRVNRQLSLHYQRSVSTGDRSGCTSSHCCIEGIKTLCLVCISFGSKNAMR